MHQSLNKVVLAFDTIFWSTEHEFLHHMPQTLGAFTDFWHWNVHSQRPLLIAFLGGRYGEQLFAKSDAEVVAEAMAVLRKIYGPATPTGPRQALITRWTQDPWARCSYTYVPLGGKLKTCETLSHPVEKRLLFAGEATTARYPGTVHGAWLTGVREAERILQTV